MAGTAHRALIQAGVAVPRNYVTAMGKEVRCEHQLSISVKPDTAALTRHCSCAMIGRTGPGGKEFASGAADGATGNGFSGQEVPSRLRQA